MRSYGGKTSVTGAGSLVVSSPVATSASGTHTWGQLIAGRLLPLVRSSIVRRALILVFATSMGLLWIGASVFILHELIEWWAALEYGGLTATTPWPPW